MYRFLIPICCVIFAGANAQSNKVSMLKDIQPPVAKVVPKTLTKHKVNVWMIIIG